MQISIIIPPYLQPYLERCSVVWNYIVVFYAMIITTSKSLYDTMIVQPQSYYQSYFLVLKNFIVPIVAIVLLFWPLVLSITMAILYSWAWFFWIISSIIIGTIQVVYASYQFCMISIDLLGLSLLKSYSVLRHYSFYYLDIAATTTVSTIGRITTSNNNNDNHNNSSTNNTSRHVWIGRKSRRRLWREKLDTAGTYENFLKIRIESKDISSLQNDIQAQQQKQRQKDRIDTALPDISSESNDDHPQQNQQQSNSTMTAATTTSMFLFNNNIHHHNHNTTNTMRRAHSFSMHPSSYLMDHCDIDGQHHIIDTSTSTPTSSPEGSPTNAIRKVPPPRRNLSFSSGDKSPFNVDKQPPSCMDPIVSHELGAKLADLLVTTMMRLKDARLASMYGSDSTNATTTNTNYNHHSTKSSSLTSLHYLLSAVVKRNHLTLDDILIENARSIANTGQYALSNQSRQLIRAYYEEVQKCLDYVADSPLTASATANVSKQQQHSCDGIDSSDSHESDNNNKNSNDKPLSSNPQQHSNHSNDNNTNNSTNNTNAPSYIISPSYDIRRHSELNERIMLIRKMKQNMGRTALMFSGGGAQAMYHLGIIRALIESRLYDDLSVISGTSGGSIAAAMCAMKTSEELYNDVCVPTVSTDFMLNGKMKEQNIRWFPSMFEMISYWMKHQLVVDSSEFGRTCEFYYSDTTFEEAFERTGKHVCITVSASRASGNTAQRLLLNHISTPNVTIASAYVPYTYICVNRFFNIVLEQSHALFVVLFFPIIYFHCFVHVIILVNTVFVLVVHYRVSWLQQS